VDNTLGQEIGEIAEIGHTYSWSPSIGLSDANISNPIALPSITTIYTVTKTNIVNGFTATASIVVAVDTIMPLPTILGNDTISVLQSNVLRIAQGGESYLWSNGLGTNDTVSISTPGIYTVTAKSLNGCTATATTEVIEVRFGSIGDLVWADYNNNGVQELTESFMDSIKVYLYDGTGTVLLDSTISDINGKYLFDSLPSGNYKLFFKTPSEAMVSPQYNGIDTLDSDINTSGWTETISIDVTKPVNDTLRNNTKKDAGYVPYGSIGDYVFEDKDFSNTQNAGDTPLPNVTVYLLNASGVIIDTTVSGIDGKYVFNNVINGDYRLQFVKPVGMNADLKNIGSDSELDSDADPITGITDLFNVNTTLTLNDPLRNLNAMDAGFNFYDPKIRLTKDGVLVGTGLVGDKITYGFTVLNTGNITLSNVFIEDTLISNSPISVSPNVLAPNQTGFAIAHYTLLAADIERGYVANSALVFGTDPIGVTVTDTSDNVNPYEPGPSDTTIVNIPKIDIALVGNSDGGCERQLDEIVTFQVIAYRQDTLSGTALLSIKDSLGANFQYISADVTGGSYDSNTNIWSNISLNFNETDTLTIKARILTNMGGYLSHSAWLISSNYNDVDSFAGDKNVTEDDYSNVFVSVPIKICTIKNESVDLTAPSGYGTYQWQLNGVNINGANSQTYTATLPGNYSIITDGNTCQSGNCCPIIIEDSCPCPPQICLPFKITKSK
ncbi:hypothetical protein EGI22_10270, partial [Lacihabitans sp. LS3-19]|uniref:SdrD B-like domain-containing protein n=1 Tax=Lacihabitans sp. LS3-19 TaxID=2487335 RepID=UPI00286EAD2A